MSFTTKSKKQSNPLLNRNYSQLEFEKTSIKWFLPFFILSKFIQQKYIYLSKSIQLMKRVKKKLKIKSKWEKEINYVHWIDKKERYKFCEKN